ncbi:MAG TPA: U32 family peptidase [Candidatus Dormibacteraeota bacterium]|nr:U32 family peptidase [Candidatus Dormibacteraeota bacterium]
MGSSQTIQEPERSQPSRVGGLPELLAPAGDWDCAKAAVENGADAIYFGLEQFNARMRAHNFTEAELPKLMEFLHRRGVKGYVTFNTLVFENELAQAEQYLNTLIAAGVDAAIVQDVGICRLIRNLSPDFPIHVSTQMTVTSVAGIEFARELGCNLVVLARECSLKEIERMVQTEPDGTRSSLPLEVFVHGALCVAYSGQCLTSEALGGRSANRGECAQACRMPYELISDGKQVALGDRKYLLSPQDLAGLEVLPELVRLGITSLKIEGRLKSPEYVASITRIYRSAIDGFRATANVGQAGLRTPNNGDRLEALSYEHNDEARYEMEMAFSRGLYTGWFGGTNNQALVHARFGKKRGVYLGEVLKLEGHEVRVRLEAALKPGDGVVFDAGKPDQDEEGGRVYRVTVKRSNGQPEALLGFGEGNIDFTRIHAGDKLWKTSDPELEKRLRQTFEGDNPRFQRPLTFEVHGCANKPLTLIARDEEGHVAQFQSAMPLVQATKQPLTTERLMDQLGRLGGTPFRLGELRNLLEGEVLLPVSELNRLRREAVAELERLRLQPRRWTLCADYASDRGRSQPAAAPTVRHGSGISRVQSDDERAAGGNRPRSDQIGGQAELIVLVRSMVQLEAALESGIETIYCDFENPKHYRDAVVLFREQDAGGTPAQKRAIFVAPPRIFKMGEEWTLKQVRSAEPDGYLIRNYDHLKFFAQDRRVGDFSLNIANRLSAEYFKERFGLERITASYDLNFGQLEALLMAAPPEWFEVTVHQHMPMFHMEHCVFCAFLSDGTDYRNCGRPCDTHDLKLRDRVGIEHPVKADVGCRNTVFSGLAQTGAEYVQRMLALGARSFRIEFVNETPGQVKQIIGKYQQLLAGQITGSQLWRELKLVNQLGVTRGQMAGRA